MSTTPRALLLVLSLGVLLPLSAPAGGGKKTLDTAVTVHDAAGKPAKNRQVILEFDDPKGPVFTNPVLTSALGVAHVKHVRTGKVKVWVDGDFSSHGTTGQAPGKITVLPGRTARFLAVDRHALEAPPEVEQSVAALAKYLAEPAEDDLDKVRGVYRWITDRIAYDFDNFLAGKPIDNSVAGVLKNRKCVCQGYAQLFEALAKKMHLTETLVMGYVKLPAGKTINNQVGGPHAWNAVQLDGQWHLFDSTHGAGGLNGGKFVKQFSEFYFEARPEYLQFSHFPEDAKWQLHEPALSKEEFDAYPRPPREIFERGFSAERIWQMLKKENVKEFCTFYVAPGRPVIFRDAPVMKTLKAGVKYHFLVEAADFPLLAFYTGSGQPILFQKKGPLYEGSIAPAKGTLKVIGSEDADGLKFHFLMGYEVD